MFSSIHQCVRTVEHLYGLTWLRKAAISENSLFGGKGLMLCEEEPQTSTSIIAAEGSL
jgi:hypothetical protein